MRYLQFLIAREAFKSFWSSPINILNINYFANSNCMKICRVGWIRARVTAAALPSFLQLILTAEMPSNNGELAAKWSGAF